MIEALFAAALVGAPLQSDDRTRSVIMDVCLPWAAGSTDLAPLEALDFVAAGEVDGGKDFASSDDQQAYLVRLTSDDGEDSGEVRRTCVLQARAAGFEAARGAIRRPLEAAGFVAEAGQPANRPVWTRQGVTVSVRQNEGRATIVRVTYSSLEE